MIQEGSIVKAKAGRDKGMLFVVVKLEGDCAYIANGKRRKAEAPKKKKLIHLQATKGVAVVYSTNREIRNTINEFGGL